SPLQKMGAPANETTAGYCAPAFIDCTASATRPAQPDGNFESTPAVCIWFCWSEWEKRLAGSCTVRLIYCVRLVGTTRFPTLAMMATFLLLNKGWISVRRGCSANGIDAEAGWIGNSTDWSNATPATPLLRPRRFA